VLGVIDMADHRHDAGNRAALAVEGVMKIEIGVAGKIARTADAVHDAGAVDVGGIDVAVDVGLDHAVHGDEAQAADQSGWLEISCGRRMMRWR
jgi:hypothetical protein